MSKQKRMKPEARKEDILSAALPLAARKGYTAVTREEIAKAAGVSGPAVQYHFKTMAQLRRDLMRFAIKHAGLRLGSCSPGLAVIAQGLAVKDPHAVKAEEAIRRAAVGAL